jgi:hypothetical protein
MNLVVRKPSTVFVEASDRVKNLMLIDVDKYTLSTIEKNEIKSLSLKYNKVISYCIDNNDIIIIDETFSDMFSTAFVKINGVPSVFIGELESYKLLVYLLYKQLKWNYDENDLIIAKFRNDIFDNILCLSHICFN